jgi:hypothetical protein
MKGKTDGNPLKKKNISRDNQDADPRTEKDQEKK